MRSGARKRLAALIHAVILAAIIYLAAPLVEDIAFAALAGVLLPPCAWWRQLRWPPSPARRKATAPSWP
ncbi:hypothetical protein ACTAF0_09090 [Streptomyces murinus]|uniref:hypothetical protein n=1 Tax=Streptomyces murinus TaxID=33900 RepID=UPI003F44DB3B